MARVDQELRAGGSLSHTENLNLKRNNKYFINH
jgi:hypothetical protein